MRPGETDPPAPTFLSALEPGQRGLLISDDLPSSELDYLRALGLGSRSPFQLKKIGCPWILEVRGTRIGLADELARRLRVVPVP